MTHPFFAVTFNYTANVPSFYIYICFFSPIIYNSIISSIFFGMLFTAIPGNETSQRICSINHDFFKCYCCIIIILSRCERRFDENEKKVKSRRCYKEVQGRRQDSDFSLRNPCRLSFPIKEGYTRMESCGWKKLRCEERKRQESRCNIVD